MRPVQDDSTDQRTEHATDDDGEADEPGVLLLILIINS